MEWFETARYRTWILSSLSIDAISLLFSYYAVPFAIAILSVLVFVYPVSTPELETSMPLPMRVLKDPGGRLGVGEAIGALQAQPLRKTYDTRLSEAPIWFEVALPQQDVANDSQSADPPPLAAILIP